MIKILFPTDYSATANNAFLYALQLCKNYDGELLVLHSYTPNIISGGISSQMTDDAATGRTLGAFDLFKEKVVEMRKLAEDNSLNNISMKFILEEGELVQNIQDVISREKFDMIIIGTTGNSGFENKILGSKTSAVIKNVKIPVLSIPHLCKFEGIDAIGFTTIFDKEDGLALKRMLPFAENNKADIYCIHINKGKELMPSEQITEWKAQFKNDPVFFIEKSGTKIVKGIFDAIEEHSIDIISCVTRNKSFIDRLFEASVAEKLSYHKRIPLLTFKEDMFK